VLAPDPLTFVRLHGVRVTARPEAIDGAQWPPAAIVVRIAPDDAFVIDVGLDDAGQVAHLDPHAIIEDEGMFCGAWLNARQLQHIVERLEWPLPSARPALAQGMAAGLSIKLWLEDERTLLIVSGSVLHEVPDRLGPVADSRAPR
jgi:hypothetical protein